MIPLNELTSEEIQVVLDSVAKSIHTTLLQHGILTHPFSLTIYAGKSGKNASDSSVEFKIDHD
jgi:hypothetical protein